MLCDQSRPPVRRDTTSKSKTLPAPFGIKQEKKQEDDGRVQPKMRLFQPGRPRLCVAAARGSKPHNRFRCRGRWQRHRKSVRQLPAGRLLVLLDTNKTIRHLSAQSKVYLHLRHTLVLDDSGIRHWY